MGGCAPTIGRSLRAPTRCPLCYTVPRVHRKEYELTMPARDIFHHAVRVALQKQGWTITHDPLPVPYGGIDLYIDLGAERMLAAERGDERIAIEIKSFITSSLVSEFHAALGQFLNYRLVLEEQDPARVLFLAIPFDTYNTFFIQPFPQLAIQRHQVKLIVYDAEREEITQWQY